MHSNISKRNSYRQESYASSEHDGSVPAVKVNSFRQCQLIIRVHRENRLNRDFVRRPTQSVSHLTSVLHHHYIQHHQHSTPSVSYPFNILPTAPISYPINNPHHLYPIPGQTLLWSRRPHTCHRRLGSTLSSKLSPASQNLPSHELSIQLPRAIVDWWNTPRFGGRFQHSGFISESTLPRLITPPAIDLCFEGLARNPSVFRCRFAFSSL